MIDLYIKDNEEKLSCFNIVAKDIVLLIDVSDKMTSDPKKIPKALKAASNFFDLYVTTNDRFALFSYSSSVNPVIALTPKNFHTYVYVKNSIDNIQSDLSLITGNSKLLLQKSHTCKAIAVVYDYLSKKNVDLQPREKWIVVFTNSFIEDNTSFDQKIFEVLKNNDTHDLLKIIIVGINMDKESSTRISDILGRFSINKKSHYLDYENFGQLGSSLKIHGDIKAEMDYPNERY